MMMRKVILSMLIFGTMSLGVTEVEAKECKAKTLREKGHIRETSSGYVEAVQTEKKTEKCVKKINDKRRAKYEEIAKKRNVDLSVIEEEAGKKLKS